MRLRRGLRCILAEPKVSQVVAAAASHSYVGERRRGGEAERRMITELLRLDVRLRPRRARQPRIGSLQVCCRPLSLAADGSGMKVIDYIPRSDEWAYRFGGHSAPAVAEARRLAAGRRRGLRRTHCPVDAVARQRHDGRPSVLVRCGPRNILQLTVFRG
jgi:hypothetical protein